jgi:hypothetical protein
MCCFVHIADGRHKHTSHYYLKIFSITREFKHAKKDHVPQNVSYEILYFTMHREYESRAIRYAPSAEKRNRQH